MLHWLKGQFEKHKAKRIFREYPARIDKFFMEEFGDVYFANWLNPLVLPKQLDIQAVKFFQKFIPKGSIALDIGANIGHMSVHMALAAGKDGAIFAFDPNPVVFKILSQNATLNPDKARIQAWNVAIANQASSFYYHSSEASFNNGGISQDIRSRHGKYVLPQKIEGVVLESFLKINAPNSLSTLSLIKIDTEGYDMEIVKSILPVIRSASPVLISECFGRLPDQKKMDYFQLLHQEGYRLTYFSDFSDQAEFVPITRPEDMLRWKHFDFIASKTDG